MPNFDGIEANSFSTVRPNEAPIGIWQHGSSTSNPLVVRNSAGSIVGGLPMPGAATAQAVGGNAVTITVGTAQQNYTLIPLTTGAARTGAILAAGKYDGQIVILVNRDTTAGNSITFDATTSTSNVATASLVISGGGACMLVWDAGSGLWYPTKATAGG